MIIPPKRKTEVDVNTIEELFPKLLTSLFIRIKTSYIKSSCRHFPGVHLHLFHHIMGEITWGILATTILNGMSYFIQILLQVDVEWWNSPMALWLLRLLLHIQYLVAIIQNNHTCALQLLYTRLLMTHDTRSTLCLGKIHKLQETKEENVIGCYHQHVIINLQLVYGKQQWPILIRQHIPCCRLEYC